MIQKQSDAVKFEGEEAGAGYASPMLDLIASVTLIALSILVMLASIYLPAPGGVMTAPGLLPFITALSLLMMAVVLFVTALRRRAAGIVSQVANTRNTAEDLRALMLIAAVAVYIAALQFLAFQYNVKIGSINYTFSAFEPVTIVVLTTIIHLAWRGPVWITTCVAVCWTLILSLIFQKVFLIPLPGGF